jgi:hypothetical protein
MNPGSLAVIGLFALCLGFASSPSSAATPAAPIKVACIGDSITEGAGLSNPALESYPARLQRLLGAGYIVRNYGVSEWFPDTVHPNTRGMAVMAAITVESLTGSKTPLPDVTLGVSRNPANRAVVAWPATAATLVLQSATRIGGTNANWAVADGVPSSDGTTLRLTNTLTGPRYFRLWHP